MKSLFCSICATLILSSFCFAQSTSPVSVFTANWNDHIDATSKKEIKLLDDQVIAAFYEGNAQRLSDLYADNLKQKFTEAQTGDFIKKVHPAIISKNYTLLDEYLVKTGARGVTQTIFKSASEDNDYKVNFQVDAEETYVSLFIYENKPRQYLFTCIYGKYNGTWKLNTIFVGPYKVLGLNSVDLYKLSKKSFENGDLIQAGIYIQLAQSTSLPADRSFVYFKLPEMMEFNKKFAQDARAKIHLPAKISGLDTTTKIFDIETAIIPEGIFPIVKYMTAIPLSDTTALKAENEKIKKEIGNTFSAIDKGKKYVFFRAYNKIPDGKIPVERYGFVMKLEEQ